MMNSPTRLFVICSQSHLLFVTTIGVQVVGSRRSMVAPLRVKPCESVPPPNRNGLNTSGLELRVKDIGPKPPGPDAVPPPDNALSGTLSRDWKAGLGPISSTASWLSTVRPVALLTRTVY